MYFSSILAITDLSVHGDLAVARAAQLAASHGATLSLLYAPLSAKPVCADPITRLTQGASAISRRTGQVVLVLETSATTLDPIIRHAAGADLLVVPHRGEQSLTTFLCGPLAIRLARLCRCPVLATQQAAQGRYQRILVAVDFAAPSRQLAALACTVNQKARVELFHTVNTVGDSRLRQADVCPEVIDTYRRPCVRYAQAQMSALTGSLGAMASRLLSAVGRGDPARQAVRHQQRVQAELLVVGKQRSTVIGDFFVGSTARRILGQTACDVLIVPHGHQASTRAAAMRRMTTVPGTSHDAPGDTRQTTS